MKICKIKNCQTKHQALGFCDKHYKNFKRHGCPEPKYEMHGMYQSREYNSWQMMKKRCSDSSYDSYKNYGGRGITVCQRWQDSFSDFLADMGRRPEGTTLDRIDNDGNYEPSNCRWADKLTQSINKRVSLVGESGIRGVRFIDRLNKWTAHIGFNKKYIHLGCYSSLDDAIKARKQAEVLYFNREVR